jgi:hypothetical protein
MALSLSLSVRVPTAFYIFIMSSSPASTVDQTKKRFVCDFNRKKACSLNLKKGKFAWKIASG